MENKSHLTAISRKNLSLPVRWLKKQGLLQGRLLDYGCGRGFDADTLRCDGYDPHYRPILPEGKFNTIFCVYVLNVLPDPKERQEVIDSIVALLDGKAYITVRLGMQEGWTYRNTYQEQVELDFPVIKKTSKFRIYEIGG